MLIRSAVAADLPQLAAIRRQFWLGQEDLGLLDRRDLSPAAIEAETGRLLARSRTVFLVADAGARLCGHALATLRAAPQLVPPMVRIVEELFVLPECAGRGLGRSLAEQALAAVPAPPGSREQIHVLAGNAAGCRFWQGLGFSPQVLIMERETC